MKYLVIGLIVVIALLVWALNRRGQSGLGPKGSSDTPAGALGQQHREGPGGGPGFGGGI